MQPVADFHIGLNAAVFIAPPQGDDEFLFLAAQPGQIFGGELIPFLWYLIFDRRPLFLQDVFGGIHVNCS